MPSMVNSSASSTSCMPSARTVSVVTGPMETARTRGELVAVTVAPKQLGEVPRRWSST